MKFRRRSTPDEQTQAAEQAPVVPDGPGPYDVAAVPDELDRIDLGALLVAPVEGLELRLQVNEETEEVGAVMLAGEEGAVELQVFAAPRNGDLWSEVRPQIAQDVARRGGQWVEREGRFGTELVCQVPAQRPDDGEGVQPSRIVGVNGPRWLLRATFLGRPAVDPAAAAPWEDALSLVAVRRGDQALPVGRQLPFVLPDEARRSS